MTEDEEKSHILTGVLPRISRLLCFGAERPATRGCGGSFEGPTDTQAEGYHVDALRSAFVAVKEVVKGRLWPSGVEGVDAAISLWVAEE